jgi:hypothetical protein
MSRFLVGSAAALVLALAGCSAAPLLGLAPAAGQKLVVTGKHEEVAASLEAGLTDAGNLVLVKRLEGEVRLAGQTRAGKIFGLYLKQRKSEGSEQTAITLRWDRDVDEEFWETVTAILKDIDPAGTNTPGAS